MEQAGFGPLPSPTKPAVAEVKIVSLDHAGSSDNQTEVELSAAMAKGMSSRAEDPRSGSEDSAVGTSARGTA